MDDRLKYYFRWRTNSTMINKSYIKAISYYLPETIVTNEELINEFPEWNVDKIVKKVGVKQRHIAKDSETSVDLAYNAALKLFDEHNISASDIDFIILCTQSPDYFLPTSACILQEKLGLSSNVGAFDFNLGCSGYIYGLSICKGLISTGVAKNILFITSETYSKFIHPKDKGNRSIFGDGAAASLISDNGFASIDNFSLGTNGKGFENLIVKTGGLRNRNKIEQIPDDNLFVNNLYMNGSEIFNFTLEAVPQLLNNTLINNNLDLESIDYFIFHQANKFMLNSLRKVCGIPKDKFYINMENTGNVVSSTVPISLKEALDKGLINSPCKVMLLGFGVGYSWGGTIISL